MIRTLLTCCWLAVFPAVGAELQFDAGDPAIVLAAQRLETPFQARSGTIWLGIDPALPAEGFRLTVVPGDIEVAGGSPRGVYYGVNRLLQMGQKGIAPEARYVVEATPAWPKRYAGDENVMFTTEQLLRMADIGFSGFTWQFRGDWRTFRADQPSGGANPWSNPKIPTVGAALADIARGAKLGLVDVMLAIHIYGGEKPLNCADDAEVDEFIALLRPAAAAGIRHLMICADDWTKSEDGRYVCCYPEETSRFGSIGAAHGQLCRRIADTLGKEFPELELSFCPAPYSLLDHEAERADNASYLAQWDAAAPERFFLVWTGPRVVPTEAMTADHFRRFQALVPHHRLIYWDNGEYHNVWPAFTSRFYPGAAADNSGLIFCNAHAYGWSESQVYLRSAAIHLWDGRNGDYSGNFREAADELYGLSGPTVNALSELIYRYPLLASDSERHAALQQATTLTDRLEAAGIDVRRSRNWLKEKESATP